jgi:hypothetical protein
VKPLTLVGVALLTAACATIEPAPSASLAPPRAAIQGFESARDTFAFRNEVQAHHPPDVPDLYANYCFVLARGVRQFFLFARFDPTAPRLTPEAYVERVRKVAAHAPWEPPLPADGRVVIPGYASLREFSRDQEAAVKAGLGERWGTLFHWTNWRVTMPVTGGHQAGIAREIIEELRSGRLAQLLVTNWPKPELNHTVVAYGYRDTPAGTEFIVWDPNAVDDVGVILFDRQARRFHATHMYDTAPGTIRVFRLYYSWFL